MREEKDLTAIEIYIRNDEDVILVRQKVRNLAREMGFGLLDQTRIVTATSELGRNIVVHAKEGKVTISRVESESRKGLKIVFKDEGPGISDIKRAMEEGFSTVGSLGLGLSGARRLVDNFEIDSIPGEGTTVTIIKWL